MTTQVQSIKEELVVLARSLHTATGRSKEQRFLLQGEEQILWLFPAPAN